MKKKYKILFLSTIFLIIMSAILPGTYGVVKTDKIKSDDSLGTDYYALLFAVGEYYNNPDQNRFSMIRAVDQLELCLLSSPNWKEENIHVVKGKEATGFRFLREMIWLLGREKHNDYSLVYITTHGSPLKYDGRLLDLPPFDESDGADEILVMYHGFEYPLSFITDDMINFLLNMMQSKGVCLIVDSCFSGGFNDHSFSDINKVSQRHFNNEFIDDIGGKGRVVLMSSEEDTVSYGSVFSFNLIDALNGKADIYGNNNGINSAEESFYYAESQNNYYGNQHPTILDLFEGELPLT